MMNLQEEQETPKPSKSFVNMSNPFDRNSLLRSNDEDIEEYIQYSVRNKTKVNQQVMV